MAFTCVNTRACVQAVGECGGRVQRVMGGDGVRREKVHASRCLSRPTVGARRATRPLDEVCPSLSSNIIAITAITFLTCYRIRDSA